MGMEDFCLGGSKRVPRHMPMYTAAGARVTCVHGLQDNQQSMYVCVHVCMRVHVCVCVCAHGYVCVWVHAFGSVCIAERMQAGRLGE